MKLKYPVAFNVTPHSWILPDSFDEFQVHKDCVSAQNKFYILKPTNSSCGRGIKVVHGSSLTQNMKDTIICSYIDRPLLIRNKKFDMRMYVLVSSFNPLRVYLY